MRQFFYKCPACGYEAPPTRYEYEGRLKPHLPEILRLLREGKDNWAVVDALGLPYTDAAMIGYIRSRYGIAPPSHQDLFDVRNSEMVAAHAAGVSYAAIGKKHGISSGRVAQIVARIEQRKDENTEAEALRVAARLEDVPIDTLNLPTRIRNALAFCGCKTVGDAMSLEDGYLRSIPNFGRHSLLLWQQHLHDLRHEFEARRVSTLTPSQDGDNLR
jgi:hypothetical protein